LAGSQFKALKEMKSRAKERMKGNKEREEKFKRSFHHKLRAF